MKATAAKKKTVVRKVVSKAAPAKRSSKTKTKGALKAGGSNGYLFKMSKLTKVPAGTGYSTSAGGVVEGDRMLVGWIDKPRGTGSRMHTHPNEQFNYVVKGTLKGSVNGKPVVAKAGSMIYIPANAPHTLVSTPDEDVIFIAIKDLSHGIIGMEVDGTMSGPHYEPGFGRGKGAGAKKAKKEKSTKTAAR
ncbi:MAG: cupin domain-containing protein [Rhodocyclaceae bacterium]|nr:cupin domain-containing protein [Rhodocyclaceae bacterium]